MKFQQIGFAYDVLKDEKRKSNYDATGKTEEVMSGKSEEEWKEYFKELWKGEVNAETLDEFKKNYQGLLFFSLGCDFTYDMFSELIILYCK